MNLQMLNRERCLLDMSTEIYSIRETESQLFGQGSRFRFQECIFVFEVIQWCFLVKHFKIYWKEFQWVSNLELALGCSEFIIIILNLCDGILKQFIKDETILDPRGKSDFFLSVISIVCKAKVIKFGNILLFILL